MPPQRAAGRPAQAGMRLMGKVQTAGVGKDLSGVLFTVQMRECPRLPPGKPSTGREAAC